MTSVQLCFHCNYNLQCAIIIYLIVTSAVRFPLSNGINNLDCTETLINICTYEYVNIYSKPI